MPKRLVGLPRVAATAIILIAAAVVLLRPVCEAWYGAGASHERIAMSTQDASDHGDRTPDAACCALGEAGIVGAVAAAYFGPGGDGPPLAAPPGHAAYVVASFVPPAVSARRVPRAAASYYLRSARILR